MLYQKETVIFTRSSTVRGTSGVKWYVHFLPRKGAESRLPWRQLGATIPPPCLEVL